MACTGSHWIKQAKWEGRWQRSVKTIQQGIEWKGIERTEMNVGMISLMIGVPLFILMAQSSDVKVQEP